MDKQNIYEFPKDIRGYWVDQEDGDTVYISKTHIHFFTKNSEKILPGEWPRLNDTGGYVYPPYSCSAFKTIRYDSLKKPIDTINNYIIQDNYVYNVNEKQLLEKGYPYRTDHDTIIVPGDDTVVIDLGQNAFLRKLNKEFYVFNINNSLVEQQKGWWQMVIIEMKEKQSMNIWYCTEKLSSQPFMLYEHDGNNYFDNKWTTEDVLHLMEQGSFKAGSKLLRINKRDE